MDKQDVIDIIKNVDMELSYIERFIDLIDRKNSLLDAGMIAPHEVWNTYINVRCELKRLWDLVEVEVTGYEEK